jgi:hypothetical protein
MTKSKYIFEQLAREEDEHKFRYVPFSNHHGWEASEYICERCKKFIKDHDGKANFHYVDPEKIEKSESYYTFSDDKYCHNPDFSKPEGMHWILARCPEKNIRVKIDIHPTGSEIVISPAITDFSKPRKSMTFYNPDELCGHLFDLVYDFLKGGRT